MTSKDLSIFNSLRPFSIGFDDMFDQFENMFSNWSNISSKPIEKGLSELNIDRSLLVIISSFVKQVYFCKPH